MKRRIRPKAGEDSDRGILDELARVEAAVAALAELVDGKDGVIARDVAANSIQRLSEIKRAIRLCTLQRSEARPIADFIKVRSDVIERLRVTPEEDQDGSEGNFEQQANWLNSNHRKSYARESQPGYAITSPRSAGDCCLA